MSAVKVTCPVCGRPNRMLTKTGKISPHNNPSKGRAGLPFGVRCKGSGRRPEDVVGAVPPLPRGDVTAPGPPTNDREPPHPRGWGLQRARARARA